MVCAVWTNGYVYNKHLNKHGCDLTRCRRYPVGGATEPSGKEFGGDHECGEVRPDLKEDLGEDVEEGH